MRRLITIGNWSPAGQLQVSIVVSQVPGLLQGYNGHGGELLTTQPFGPIPFPLWVTGQRQFTVFPISIHVASG